METNSRVICAVRMKLNVILKQVSNLSDRYISYIETKKVARYGGFSEGEYSEILDIREFLNETENEAFDEFISTTYVPGSEPYMILYHFHNVRTVCMSYFIHNVVFCGICDPDIKAVTCMSNGVRMVKENLEKIINDMANTEYSEEDD